MNLHNIVKNAIGAVNPHEPIYLYRATGKTNVKGKITPNYTAVNMTAQVQGLSAQDLELNDMLAAATHKAKFYLDAPADSIDRFSATTGDIIKRADGSYWNIVQVAEDFRGVGWECVLAVMAAGTPEGIPTESEGGNDNS